MPFQFFKTVYESACRRYRSQINEMIFVMRRTVVGNRRHKKKEADRKDSGAQHKCFEESLGRFVSCPRNGQFGLTEDPNTRPPGSEFYDKEQRGKPERRRIHTKTKIVPIRLHESGTRD